MSIRLCACLVLIFACSAAYADDYQNCGTGLTFTPQSNPSDILTAVDNPANAGSIVCLLAGQYAFAAPFTIANNVIVTGPALAADGRPDNITLNFSGNPGFNFVQLGNNSKIENVSIAGAGQSNTTYGVLAFQIGGANVAFVDIQHVLIAIGIINSQHITVSGATGENNGDPNNTNSDGSPKADPSVYISSSANISISNSTFFGGGNTAEGRGGDGDIAAHQSVDVVYTNVNNFQSGAGGYQMDQCRGCTVEGGSIDYAQEYGFDIDCDTEDLLVDNVTIGQHFVGNLAYVDARDTVAVVFSNDIAMTIGTNEGSCAGLNIDGTNQTQLVLTNDTGWQACGHNVAPPACLADLAIYPENGLKPQENTSIFGTTLIL